MIDVTLSIRPANEPQRPATAWFVAGDDPRVWLDELSRWQMPLDQLRLYLLPRSSTDRRAIGVLVLPPPGVVPAQTLRAKGYGRCSSRLYLPVAARPNPPASEAEIDAAVVNDVAIWHPSAGLIGVDDTDAITVAELLEPPIERSTSWEHARPGILLPPRLLAVLPPATPPIENALVDWSDDIGSEEPDHLPPAPAEPSDSPPAKLGRAAKLAFARIVQKLTALAPRTATAPTWVNRLENWAARQVQLFGNALDAARRKQIDRLLHLLDSDPDRGLRHAIPFRGDSHRGEGPPGWQLPTNNLNFSLDHLGGGARADRWQLEAEQQLSLQRRYRELANRELQLGRHRRAAYIFAELLGDLPAAASALEHGGHDREAAILYRQRLNRPLDAARCFERCGGWEEAIEIYSEQKEFEKAAELLARLDRPDDAAAMYRRAVRRWRESDDQLRAARLLEEKLDAVDEAVDVLAGAWPSSHEAGTCLSELFALFGRHARHDDATRWIARLRNKQSRPDQLGRSVQVLATVAQKYPNPPARHQAADAARVLVGGRLPKAEVDEATTLVKAVRSLVPQDDLLGRDVARWLARYRRPNKDRVAHGSRTTVIETGHFRLPDDVTYKAALAFAGYVAAGFTTSGVAAIRFDFSRAIQRFEWNMPLAAHPIVLAADACWVAMGLVGASALEPQYVHGPPGNQRIGTPSWLTRETLAVAASSDGVWWTIDDHLLLTAIRDNGGQISSQQLSLAELGVRFEPRDEAPERMAVMLAPRENVYLGIGHTLLKVKSNHVEQIQLNGWIRQLVAAPHVLQHRVAAAYEDYGAAVIWDDLNGRDMVEIAHDFERPELAFTLDGQLVAVNAAEGRIYSTSNRSVALRGGFPVPNQPIAAVLCGERPGEFAVLTEDGEVRCYRVD